MKNFTRVCALVLALVMVFGLVACGGKVDGGNGDATQGTDSTGTTGTNPTNPTNPTDPTNPTNPGSDNGKKTYSVSVTTVGGMGMEGINVYIFADAGLTDMKAAGGTNEKGQYSFDMAEGTYYVQLQGVPNGYQVETYYTFSGTSCEITLVSSLVTGESPIGNTFEVGDVMYDFSFTDTEGNQVVLSEVLAEKELVVLNYWYTTCSACLSEFPVLDEAYQMFADNVEVLGLNSYALDDENAVAGFEASYGLELTFPLGKVNSGFNPQCFINPMTGDVCAGYPTSVFIDRYGVICAIEVGSMTSLTQWASVFNHFVGDDYKQRLVTTLDELIVRMEPTYEMPSTEEITNAVISGDFTVDFRGEADDIYSWPFIITEKDGRTCLKASNQRMYESYAILYANVYLEAGQAFGFDYLASSEAGGDYLHVIVDGEAIYTISGINDEWKSAYCWVAPAAGTYEIALCYIKDTDIDAGDDTVYISNMRVVPEEEINTPSYIPGQAAVEQEDGSFEYVTVVYNEKDGYYHVGSANGPLLLANLLGYTQLVPDDFLYNLALQGEFVLNGHDYLAEFTPFCTVASNSVLNGYCTVTYELAEILKVIAQIKGFDGHEYEWLKVCKYYSAYGTNGQQLEDPSAGLAWWAAYEAVMGEGYVNADGKGQNFFYYDGHPILPRGYWARFTPEKSGVYRITSRTDYTDGLNAWLFDRDGNLLYEFDGGEMLAGMYADDKNVTMVYYMEAGKDYYIDIALYDIYGVGYVMYDIEYLGTAFDLLTSCSPGPFTYELESGQTIIGPHIDAALGEDGFYREVLERDEDGNPIRFGSIVYAYFDGPTTLFAQSIRKMIELNGFDFSMNEYDLEIVSYLKAHDGDVDATDAFLREMWGADYETYAEIYQLEDIYAGRYHGKGENLTEEISTYLDKVIYSDTNPELNGCVALDARLAELLTMLMDKYTFEDVDDSWQKLCYYYKHLGPQD